MTVLKRVGLGVKWTLVVIGAYLICGLAYVEIFTEHRVGLGTGTLVAVLAGLIKGIITAVRGRRPVSPAPPQNG